MTAFECSSKTPDAEQGKQWLSTRLSPTEIQLLDVQGFVSHERLPSGAMCAKLRFRDDQGRQRVVYLGVDPRRSEEVAAHLAVRQAATRRRKASTRLRRRGRRLLRGVKPCLQPHLRPDEWHFHGLQLRRRRRCAAKPPQTSATLTTSTPGVYLTMNEQNQKKRENSNYDGLRQWAQIQGSPFDAAIGHLTADLCDIAVDLAGHVKAELREATNGVAESPSLRENLRSYLQLARQADRFIQLAPRTQLCPGEAKNCSTDTYDAGEPDDRTGEPARLPAQTESDPPAAR